MKHKKSFVIGGVLLLSGLGTAAFAIYAAKTFADLLEKLDLSDPLDEEENI